jgi:hypothetical protein
MPNGIYLTLEQYKDKDLPITITINGHTYHSQYALATTQTTWFEMGKQHVMELGSDNTYSDKEMSRMHDQWYNEGYADGYEQCKHDGISKINYNTEPVEQTELSKEYDKGFTKGYEEGYEAGKKEATLERVDQFNKGYEIGKYEGYEAGKKANGISNKELPGEWVLYVEQAYKEGYEEGYNDAKGEDDYCKDCKEEPGKDEQNAKELPGEYLSHIEEARLEGYADGLGEYLSHIEEARIKGYADGFNDGKEQGFEEGFMNLKLILKK